MPCSETNCDYWLVGNGVYTGTKLAGTGGALDFGCQTNSGIYTVLASNSDGCIGWMNGNAIVDVMTPPRIITQPQEAFVCTNGQAVISVIATGGNLTFQWRKDGTNLPNGGHYYGVTTSNLITYPATSADVASAGNGYDCVITNSCGSITSAPPVALTLTAQTNLYWYGGTTNVWDVTVSEDWASIPTGFPDSFFNFGDNVIFDENAYPISPVILASPNLTPTRVTVNNDFDPYAFTGPGSISGSNSALFKIGTASLLISNANSYAGGTTISNGAVYVFNANSALGVGPVTVVGGTLGGLGTILGPVTVQSGGTCRPAFLESAHSPSTTRSPFKLAAPQAWGSTRPPAQAIWCTV